jgi:hypothetical protein
MIIYYFVGAGIGGTVLGVIATWFFSNNANGNSKTVSRSMPASTPKKQGCGCGMKNISYTPSVFRRPRI